MSLHSELKEILDELRRYFESQKILGLESVVLSYPREEEKLKAPMKQPTRIQDDKEKSVIKIEEQLDIFDQRAKKITLEEIREEIGDCT
jgi:hypothetical protein